MSEWSKKYDKCVGCGTMEIKHHGYGLCDKCYENPELYKREKRAYKLIARPNAQKILQGRKLCSKCQKWFPANVRYFNVQKKSGSGFYSVCRKCRKPTHHARHIKDKEVFEKNFMTAKPTSISISKYGYKIFSFGNWQVPEQRLVMMRHLGRLLERWEEVHHVDKDKTNNRIENLAIVPHSDIHDLTMHQKRTMTYLLRENKKLQEQLKRMSR